ncbi:MAG: type secretion system protein VirB9 [Gammaproteobacteria bacterium]|nr:type secretion system protein VirB9 [Gammaproteobacteria bacterium]
MKHATTVTAAFGTALLGYACTATALDSRIRHLDYDADSVVRLDGCFGFQTMVEFGPSEHIENVGLGDASRWLVVPNKRANILFVKPAFPTSHSNMTVATDRHSYNFELVASPSSACQRGLTAYSLRFRYPLDVEPPEPAPAAISPGAESAAEKPAQQPEPRNTAYTFTGARDNVPQRVFDDGRKTYFRWAEGVGTPAVYAVASDKTEALVSFTSQGDYLVVDQIAPAYLLRRGNAVAVLYNDSYQSPALDSGSPQPHAQTKEPSHNFLARLFAPESSHAR